MLGMSLFLAYLNKGVVCKLTITPTHKIAAPMWIQDDCHKMASRGGQLEKGNVGDQASRGGELRVPGLQGRAVRVDQPCREGQLGVTRWQRREVGGNQACRGGQFGGNPY
ncbi:unnamed protein product [Pipistrellus nathusii]|uniref:Uncharacterized protein n=1 Tax=Pipistrellus nathusii TaxID=59473 RepID=A0ABP0A596_PIPNA